MAGRLRSKLLNVSRSDHRQIGLKQELFFFHKSSPGSCFFRPNGAHIYNKLVDYIKREYRRRNYHEVITPNIYDLRLYERSGHLQHYKDNMILLASQDELQTDSDTSSQEDIKKEFGLKPMNCPSHCIMFKSLNENSDTLPVRWADFGALHRNELSGTVKGLTRLRRFQQDDAHIFCTSDQVEAEISDCLDFASQVYGDFNFAFDLKLSLRPANYMGDSKLWDQAEESLRQALDKSQISWEEQQAEGAFYGPKIDMMVRDCQDKSVQCATIQLDFQLPQRFKLDYYDKAQQARVRPVLIHRAIFGSIERFIAMLAENCNGRWPFWISPFQAKVIPLHADQFDYAKTIAKKLFDLGFQVESDLSDDRYKAKIVNALQVPYQVVIVVGAREMQSNSVNCRIETGKRAMNIQMSVDELASYFKEFEELKINDASEEILNKKAVAR